MYFNSCSFYYGGENHFSEIDVAKLELVYLFNGIEDRLVASVTCVADARVKLKESKFLTHTAALWEKKPENVCCSPPCKEFHL